MSGSLPETVHDRLPELPALTGLRGFAALWVLLYHVWAMSGGPPLRLPGIGFMQGSNLLSVGWSGVDLFFCLSAFLLVMPFAQWRYGSATRPNTGRYLLRRVLRIYPAYLFQLFVLLFAAVVFDYGRVPTAYELVAHLFLWFYIGWNW
ncbi:acyltransferase family protein, partial [Dokdonella sp.]|uniref:acyltransferase family protein n=1 Tax=Dokdonella sp. TaxID=2291710 RepID=UPI003C47D0B1